MKKAQIDNVVRRLEHKMLNASWDRFPVECIQMNMIVIWLRQAIREATRRGK